MCRLYPDNCMKTWTAAGSGASRSPSVLSGVCSVSTRDAERPGRCGSVFITEEVDGVGDEVRRYHSSSTQTLFEASLNMSPRSASTAKVPAWELKEFYYNTFLMFLQWCSRGFRI